MSKYIDADNVLELLDLMYDNQADKDDPYNVGVMGAINYIKHKAPSLEIIRCRECKHRKPSGYVGSVKTYECDITGFRMHDLTNHFCSYGERE